MTTVAETLENLTEELRPLVRGDLLFDGLSRAAYSSAAGIFRLRPTGVILPLDERDIAAVLKWASERVGRGEEKLSVVARGAGTGVAGQAIGTGLILDVSRYMNGIQELQPLSSWARVQPGVICDDLNRALAPSGVFFPPDPSSSGYCTVGGMISTNAAGAHTIKYGATIDYVESVEVVLSDGERVSFEEVPLERLRGPVPAAEPRALALARRVAEIVEAAREEIEKHSPKTAKNSSGYRLDRLIRDGTINLSRLITGSEGTLAIVTGAKVRVIAKPPVSGLGVAFFSSVERASEAIAAIRALDPSTLDLMDGYALDVVRQGRPDLAKLIDASANALLFVEFEGDSEEAVRERIEQLRRAVVAPNGPADGVVPAISETERKKFWLIRKAFLPLLYRAKGRQQAVAFVEDVTVPPEKVASYVRAFYEILGRYGVKAAISGHAGDGNFHARPFLDLSDPGDKQKMNAIAEEVFKLVLSLGGTLSGEHGDGLVRTPFLRRQFGPLYERFVEIKRLFDPHGILNPGKIIDEGTAEMAAHLKADLSLPQQWETNALELAEGEPADQLRHCQACGNCRLGNEETNRMCPVFRALRSELVTPRAKANLLREALSGELKLDEQSSRELKELFDLCLMCRACALECPAEVDVPKLIQEVRARLARSLGLSPEERVMSAAGAVTKAASATAPLTNAAMKLRPARWLMEKATGLDRRRPPVPFAIRRVAKALAPYADRHNEKVIYFLDLYAGSNEPSLALKVAQVLDKNARSVILPGQTESGMPAIAYGDVARVRRLIRHNVSALLPYVREGRAIVTAEPTGALCFREEYRNYDASDDVREVGEHVFDLFQYLWMLHEQGQLNTEFRPIPARLAYHAPCHLRALKIGRPALEVLKLIPGLQIDEIDKGCCGMAGTFGMRTKNYELSMRIGRELFAALRDPMIDAAVSDCSSCRMQISHGTGKPALHPVDVLHMAYGLSEGDSTWGNWMARRS